MEKVRLFVQEGRKSRTVGLNTSPRPSDKELLKLVDLIEDILANNFPELDVIEAPSVVKIGKSLPNRLEA